MSVAESLAELMSTPEGKEEMKALWDRLDSDGNKQISGKEWGEKVWAEKEMMSK